jgi:hypothetical protein
MIVSVLYNTFSPCALARVPAKKQANTIRRPKTNERFRKRVTLNGIIRTPFQKEIGAIIPHTYWSAGTLRYGIGNVAERTVADYQHLLTSSADACDTKALEIVGGGKRGA